ncbi:PadR family transcriptional regulator [Kutzneria buriramensis]|uniref:DNA-binding PadR family transcriptional regulator n=1 Tax=Kutzneria buriramensis TaxID=1045776 RepID=A0A3E0H645_9PSEU|nr:PadR family transcriptional regulator [Kutzneria buriramensis]REH38120.1 DNA-binding PadR family transcriptional regulator [Kutzneria buriramensis]
MSLRHAPIGLLREGPASGYDLIQIFTASLGTVWPATRSQIYTEPARLADAGLVTVTARGPRGRKEYAPTATGLAELRRWLLATTPEAHPRSELLLRVFLLGGVTRGQVRDYLGWVRARAEEDVIALGILHDTIDWGDGETDLLLYGRLVLEFGRRLSELTRDWTDWATEQIIG